MKSSPQGAETSATELKRLRAENAALQAQCAALRSETEQVQKDLEFALWGGELTLWKYDLRTRLCEFSDGWYRVNHYERGKMDMRIEAVSLLVHPDDLAGLSQAHVDHFEGRAPHAESEHRLLGGDGVWRWMYDRSYVVERNAQGQPLLLVGTQYEITDRKRAEAAAREHAARFQAFMDHLPAHAFIKDQEGHYLFGNRAWANQFTQPHAELLGKTDFDLWPEATARLFRATDLQTLQSGKPQYAVEEAGGPEHDELVFSVSKFPIPRSEGETLVGGVAMDISEQVRVQRKLGESEERLRAFLDNSPSIMFLKDVEGRYLHVNRKFAEVFHRTLEEVLGRTDAELFPHEQAAAFRANDLQVIQSGQALRFEEVAQHDDGPHTSLVTKFPLVSSNGQIRAVGGIVTDISDRIRAEQALSESEARFRELAQSVGLIPWEWDYRERRYSYVGPQAERILGYAAAQWLEPGFWERIIEPDDLEATRAACQLGVQEGDHYDLEYRLRSASGEIIWMHDIAHVVRHEGKPIKLRGYLIDISRRKQAEMLLQESEARFRSITTSAPDFVLLLGPERRIEYINYVPPTLTLEAIRGSTPESWVREDHRAQVTATLDRVFSDGAICEYVAPTVDYGEGENWFWFHWGPILKDGQVTGAVLIARNINEQRRVTEALRESEERYRLLADNSTDIIGLVAPDLTLKYISPACRALLGYEPHEVIGKCGLDFVLPEDLQQIAREFMRLLKENKGPNFVHRLIRKDGSLVWVESTGQVRYDPQTGAVLDVVTSIRNIDERVKADRQLREREAQLAHVARLTTLGEIATELAHEINQPLYAISNFADACLTHVESNSEANRADRLRWIHEMATQARRAAECVRRFGRFARKGDFELSTFDLNLCVRDVTQLVEYDLKRHGIALGLHLTGETLLVRAERILMEQVIINLLRNAIEAMETVAGVKHRLLIETFRTPHGLVGVAVADTGPGVPGNPDQLFEPYYTTKPEGSGMGLAICRTTLEALGGRISASNIPGGGARFEFQLPATAAKPA